MGALSVYTFSAGNAYRGSSRTYHQIDRLAHGVSYRSFVYLGMAQAEDPPQLTRPGHVSERDWEIRLRDYDTALARYDGAVEAIDNEMRQGLLPTGAHQQAERAAQNALALARGALLSLYRHLTERH